MEEHVLDHVDRDAGVSTKQAEKELNLFHMTIWRVLHEQLFYFYHLQRAQISYFQIFQHKRTFDGILFIRVLGIPLLHQCWFQIKRVSVEMASSLFITNTSGQRRVLMVQSILDTRSSSA
jgi:hypothetical protein